MPLERVVPALFDFVEENFNENVVRYFSRMQKCVVFVDPFSSENRARMLRRGTGGDAQRARIRRYAPVQAISYYVTARIFGWQVFCVPYDYETRTYQPDRYSAILERLLEIFDKRRRCDEAISSRKPTLAFSEQTRDAPPDDEYDRDSMSCARATGIYK